MIRKTTLAIQISVMILFSSCAAPASQGTPTRTPLLTKTSTILPTGTGDESTIDTAVLVGDSTLAPIIRPISLVLWGTNFDNGMENFNISIDQSVGCEHFPIQMSDIDIHTIQDATAPSANAYVLELIANTSNKGGLFVNAIAHRDIEFIEDSRYIFEGYFKKVADSKPEQIDINLQLVQDYNEYYAEIIWTLNPYSPFYNWIWTRVQDFRPVKLFELQNDSKWHYFKLIAEYRSNPTRRYISTIQVDNQSIEPNLEMGIVKKEWQSSFTALLETHNMYTNCDEDLVFVGKSRWDNISVTIEPVH